MITLICKCRKETKIESEINKVLIAQCSECKESKRAKTMTLEDYKAQKRELDNKYIKATKQFSIGDIITNGHFVIKVESIIGTLGAEAPYAIYEGARLKKDHTPYKSGKIIRFYEFPDTRHQINKVLIAKCDECKERKK